MKRFFILIVYLISNLFLNSAIAQDDLKTAEAKDTKKDTKTFKIISLDGKNEKVTITPDYVGKVLTITCLESKISIPDFWGVFPEIRILNKNFIELTYAVRGGSNIGLGNTLIVCVSHNKLCVAIHVLNHSSFDAGDEKDNYHIKLVLNGSNDNNYRLNVSIHDNVISKPNPEISYNYNNETVLSFDNKKDVFYSIKESIHNYYIVPKGGKKQKISGNYPIVFLGKETYYFINNKWYQPESSEKMSEF